MSDWKRLARSAALPHHDVDALLRTAGAVPVHRATDHVVLVGEAGPARLSGDGSLEPLPLPDSIADSDEILVARSGIVGVSLDRPVTARLQSWDGRHVERDFDVTSSEPLDEVYSVVTGDNLYIVVPDGDRTRIHDLGDLATGGENTRVTGGAPAHRDVTVGEGFEIADVTGSFVVAKADAGPLGDRLRILSWNRPDETLFECASDHTTGHWFGDGGRVAYVVERAVTGDRVTVLRADGSHTRLRPPGAVGTVGGDDSTCLISCFDGVDEAVYRIVADPAGARVEPVAHRPGKKYVGRHVPGWLTRGVLTGIGYEDGHTEVDANPAERAGECVKYGLYGEAGPTALRFTPTGTPRGTVVHLHGGPEAYETDELRLFGLPGHAVRHGWEWRSLNYRGSRGPTPEFTTTAWRNWARTAVEDVKSVLADAPAGPLVVAGWSFGAALALAVALNRGVDGLILGGAMGPLAEQIERAVTADPAHGDWFGRRFDAAGSDGLFFDCRPPQTRRELRVLGFHGVDDEHCPYDVFARVREAWSPLVAEWRHHDIPDGGHYAESVEDARLVASACREFLTDLA